MAGRIHDVNAVVVPINRGVLGEDGNAAFTLLIIGIHDSLGVGVLSVERTGLLQQAVHQRGLAMVDVSNDGNIAKRCHDEVGLWPDYLREARGVAPAPRIRFNPAQRNRQHYAEFATWPS